MLLLTVATLTAAEPVVGAPLPPSAVQPVPAAATPDDRVVVRPFTNITGAAEDEWIGAGIVETLTADLRRVLDVSVITRQPANGASETASRGAGASERPEISAARLLGAGWVIGGAFQRLGDRIRITARVVEVATGAVAHTTLVDGTVSELFALQDRLVEDLGQRLNARGRSEASAGAGAMRAAGATPPHPRGKQPLRKRPLHRELTRSAPAPRTLGRRCSRS